MNELNNEQKSEITNYSAGTFEGPLDLLLFLIKKKEINIDCLID